MTMLDTGEFQPLLVGAEGLFGGHVPPAFLADEVASAFGGAVRDDGLNPGRGANLGQLRRQLGPVKQRGRVHDDHGGVGVERDGAFPFERALQVAGDEAFEDMAGAFTVAFHLRPIPRRGLVRGYERLPHVGDGRAVVGDADGVFEGPVDGGVFHRRELRLALDGGLDDAGEGGPAPVTDHDLVDVVGDPGLPGSTVEGVQPGGGVLPAYGDDLPADGFGHDDPLPFGVGGDNDLVPERERAGAQLLDRAGLPRPVRTDHEDVRG